LADDDNQNPTTSVDTRTSSKVQVANVNRQTKGVAAAPFGVKVIPADPFENKKLKLKGLKDFYVAAASEVRVRDVFKAIRDKGGKVTSSGGQRDLNASVTPARGKGSLHYPGIAVDLYMFSGMIDTDLDQYIVTLDPQPDGSIKTWTIFCKTEDSATPEITLQAQLMVNIARPAGVSSLDIRHPCRLLPPKAVTGRFFSVTELFLSGGFQRISAKSGFIADAKCRDYEAAEWWHFQDETDLVVGTTTLRQALLRVYTSKQIESSKLKDGLDAIWNGKVFA
jgi:hypothetical protein